jgi:NAD(P)-dependent dehydrogenase (short-subunit alcohol dehydrogenase family)
VQSNTESGPVAIVTGASRHLGQAIARGLVQRQFQVATCASGSTAPNVGESLHQRVDVGDPAAVARFVGAVRSRFGRVDALVNNAGFVPPLAALSEAPVEDAQRTFATNALGPIYLLRETLSSLLAAPRGGVVVNVASRAALTPVPRLATYSASKSALVALTLDLAKENPGDRLLCVAVCPGGMATAMRSQLFGPEEAAQQLDPEQVARLIVEIVAERTVEGKAFKSGSAVLVTKETGVKVVEWPPDPRGHASLEWQ